MLELMDIMHEPTHLEAFLLGYIYANKNKAEAEEAVGYIADYIADWEDTQEVEAYKSLADIGPDFDLYVEVLQEAIEITVAEAAIK